MADVVAGAYARSVGAMPQELSVAMRARHYPAVCAFPERLVRVVQITVGFFARGAVASNPP